MKRALSTLVISSLLIGGFGCSDRSPAGPEIQVNPPPGVTVSDAHVKLASNALTNGSAALTADATVAYVSAEPGTFPSGLVVKIRNEAGGGTVTADMISGGFDPVSIAARAGDKLALVITTVTGDSLALTVSVPPRLPPVVVRINPAKGRIDVALTQVITVVFSEPVDPATVNGASIALLDNNGQVSATPTLSNDGLTVSLTAPLAPSTTYQLVVSKQVRDLSGDPLDNTETVSFTTESPPQATGPQGVRIVFQRYDQLRATSHIWAMNGDGSDPRQLTNEPLSDVDPTVSPDGTKIAFVRGGLIYVMNVDGSDANPVSPREGAHPTWSPDGQRIAFENPATTGLSVVRTDGTGLVDLTDASVADKVDIQPAWSPDGTQIAFMRWEGLEWSVVWIMNADGTGARRVGRQELVSGSVRTWASWGPVWSRDSQRIAFAGPNDAIVMAIFAMNRDGSNASELVTVPQGMYVNNLTDWSADGRWIAFTASALGPAGSGTDIYLLTGASLKRVTIDGLSSSASFLEK